MKYPLENYREGGDARVFSLVTSVPFSPLDIDVGRLARGEWNPLTDRFRFWYLPGEDGKHEESLCYLMVRKFEPETRTLAVAHVNVNLAFPGGGGDSRSFTIGILCNDDIRARAALNAMLEIPPAFHRRSELQLIERKWRRDPTAVMRFMANVHSVMAQTQTEGAGVVYDLKFDLPPAVKDEFKRGLGGWWDEPRR